ncbi:pyridoxal phosphate-dependent aminotransferase [Clostridium sediminicola]|uniref:pyridoxal phosphate-dependent aminotransferase n=1 Tax=Clostridium sediminicola TaxID=3114879 RepID=UPI0031F227A2
MKSLSLKNSKVSASVTLGITAKAKEMKVKGEDVVFFSVGEPDFKTPENIRNAAKKLIDEGNTGYTAASGLPQLKKSICKKLLEDNGLSYENQNIIVSNGAKHSLFNVLQAICNPNDEVILAVPYWVSYTELIKMAEGKPVFVETKEEEGFKFSKAALEAVLTENTKAIIVNSPNNPTGSIYSREDLQMIADFAVKNDLYIIADEIYEKLVYDGEHISIASLGEEVKERTIVINGMSKGYAMTGWRIGYTAASKDIIKIMSNVQSHSTSNPNTVAQYASIEALEGPQESIAKMKKAFDERREYIVKLINDIEGISCRKPEGAFYVMMNINELLGKTIGGKVITNSMEFAEMLLEECKVATIPGIGFGQEGYIRLSYATSMENIKKGMERIASVLVK